MHVLQVSVSLPRTASLRLAAARHHRIRPGTRLRPLCNPPPARGKNARLKRNGAWGGMGVSAALQSFLVFLTAHSA